MSKQLISKGYDLYVVNSDNKIFSIKDWPKSKTFCLENQEKLIFSDNQTRSFNSLDENNKLKIKKIYWG